MKFSDLHLQLLNTIQSDTLASMSDEDIARTLNLVLIRAIADFLFPRVSLDYERIPGEIEDYQFVEKITQKEINVILALSKKIWLEQQLDNENHLESVYYDKDVRTHSRANLLKQLNSRYQVAQEEVRLAQYNYSRSLDNKPTVGDIYE